MKDGRIVNPEAEAAAPREPGRSAWLRTPGAMLRRLNGSPHRMWLLAIASFLETIVIPIAMELVLVPFMLANRGRVWRIATVTLAGCLAAAMVGYAIGALVFDTAGQWALQTLDLHQAFDEFQARFQDYGFWAIVLVGITPIPFPIAMLAAGAAGYSIPLFLLACAVARGVRYYGLAVLVLAAGPLVERWFDRLRRAWAPRSRRTAPWRGGPLATAPGLPCPDGTPGRDGERRP